MTNPFSAPSTLPYSLPPFAEIRDEHYEPAFLEGMEQQRAEIAAITADPRSPDVREHARSARAQRRDPDPGRARVLQQDLRRLQRPHERPGGEAGAAARRPPRCDRARLGAVRADRGRARERRRQPAWMREQRYLVERWHTEMTIAGAGLDDADKETLRDLNQRISTLTTKFDKNLLSRHQRARGRVHRRRRPGRARRGRDLRRVRGGQGARVRRTRTSSPWCSRPGTPTSRR